MSPKVLFSAMTSQSVELPFGYSLFVLLSAVFWGLSEWMTNDKRRGTSWEVTETAICPGDTGNCQLQLAVHRGPHLKMAKWRDGVTPREASHREPDPGSVRALSDQQEGPDHLSLVPRSLDKPGRGCDEAVGPSWFCHCPSVDLSGCTGPVRKPPPPLHPGSGPQCPSPICLLDGYSTSVWLLSPPPRAGRQLPSS